MRHLFFRARVVSVARRKASKTFVLVFEEHSINPAAFVSRAKSRPSWVVITALLRESERWKKKKKNELNDEVQTLKQLESTEHNPTKSPETMDIETHTWG